MSVKKRKLYGIHEKEGESSRPAAGITLPIKKEPIEWGDEEENGGDREQAEGFTAPINHEVEEAGGVGGDRVPRVGLPAPNIEVGGTREQASEEMNQDLQSVVTSKQLKGVCREGSEGDDAGQIGISPGSGVSPSRILNSYSFPNFQEMGDALSHIVTEGMAGKIDSASCVLPNNEGGLVAPPTMIESSTSAALNNLYFSFASRGWGENFVSPVAGQVTGGGGCHQGIDGVTKFQYSGFLSFSSHNLGNNVNAGEATGSSFLKPLIPEYNVNQGEAKAPFLSQSWALATMSIRDKLQDSFPSPHWSRLTMLIQDRLLALFLALFRSHSMQ